MRVPVRKLKTLLEVGEASSIVEHGSIAHNLAVAVPREEYNDGQQAFSRPIQKEVN